MKSKRDFKDAPASEIRLPKEVYYRCLWTVRDSRRLAEMAELSLNPEDRARADYYTGGIYEKEKDDSLQAMLVSEEAAEKAGADLECINRAISKIPEVYREGLLDNIIDKTDFGDFAHPNTWKRWKLVFIYELARELRLI